MITYLFDTYINVCVCGTCNHCAIQQCMKIKMKLNRDEIHV